MASDTAPRRGRPEASSARWRQRFNEMLREAEEQRHADVTAAEPPGLLQRAQRRLHALRRRAHRRTAAAVASPPRRLRGRARAVGPVGEDEALRHHPQDAQERLRSPSALGPDRSGAADCLGAADVRAGPQRPAYYFTFNVVGPFPGDARRSSRAVRHALDGCATSALTRAARGAGARGAPASIAACTTWRRVSACSI